MSQVEQSAVLFYADYLRLEAEQRTVTDNCRYFFVHGVPMNACYIAGVEPFYDETNQYYIQALHEYETLKSVYGKDGVMSFIEDICILKTRGMTDAEKMLTHIFQYCYYKKLKSAIAKYRRWKNNITYRHIIKNDDGNPQLARCSAQIAHVEKTRGDRVESSIQKSSRIDDRELEKNP